MVGKAPIFIVGANRSGTTLLRLVLNAHSSIAIPEELEYFKSYLGGVDARYWRRPDISREEYVAFVQLFLEHNEVAFRPLRIEDLKRLILDKGALDMRHPYQVALEAWAHVYGKERWGEKTPGNLFYSDIILDMFPNAQFIYVVRDPRAGVSSMQQVSFFPDDIVFNALNRHKHHSIGWATLQQNIPASQRMIVRYEDLVTAPDKTVRLVCDFLGEAYEPSMLCFHKEAHRFMSTDASSAFNAAATEPVSSARTEAWKKELTSDEVAIVEHVCASEMHAFGYVFDQRAMRLRDRLSVFLKTQYWNVQCRRHSHIRHYCVQHRMFGRTRARLERVWGLGRLMESKTALRILQSYHRGGPME